jgi:hypothetical protein
MSMEVGGAGLSEGLVMAGSWEQSDGWDWSWWGWGVFCGKVGLWFALVIETGSEKGTYDEKDPWGDKR